MYEQDCFTDQIGWWNLLWKPMRNILNRNYLLFSWVVLVFSSPAFSSILAWQSPLCRNVVANTMKSLSTWLFSKVIRHVWPGKSAPPTCQVKSVDDYIFKCCLQLHTTRAQRQNSRGLGWTFAAIYWFEMEEQYMLLDSLKWWANSALGVGKKLFLLSKKIPVERNCYGQSQNHM